MGFRYRRSIKLAPGVKLNLSGGGVSWTLGGRGASIGIGKRGTYVNGGIPGTGLRYRTKLNAGASHQTSHHRTVQQDVALRVEVTDAGEVLITDQAGQPVPERYIAALKRQHGETLRATIQEQCDKINAQVEALGELHVHTPDCATLPHYDAQAFAAPPPIAPVPRSLWKIFSWFKWLVRFVERRNLAERQSFEAELAAWRAKKGAFEAEERRTVEFFRAVNRGEPDALETHFEQALQEIVWPRETSVQMAVSDDGCKAALSVDLPKLDDMPHKVASVPQRGYRLSVKDMSAAQVQKLYMRHVHGVGFRLIGEAYAACPTLEELVLSAYAFRANQATGAMGNEYLYSVRVQRRDWEAINFANLAAIDVVEALDRFELRRTMSKAGAFKPVQPFESAVG